MIIGSHVSFKKQDQMFGSVKEALSYGCNTFMFYTGAPQNTNRITIDSSLTNRAKLLMKEKGIDIKNVVIHAPYIINLANAKNFDFNIRFLKEEIKRVETLGISMLVLHPGSHVGLGKEQGMKNIINCLNNVLNDDINTIICIETMAGKGTELMYDFRDIKFLLDNVDFKDKVKVCLDTCHINDAGYDIKTVIEEFDRIIGIDNLKCIHINDSKNEKSSHKDRHENIGLGTIGFENLINIIYNDKLKNIPMILETPYVTKKEGDKEKIYPPYKFEIEMIKNKKFNNDLLEDIRNHYK